MPNNIIDIIKQGILENALTDAVFGRSRQFIERAFDSMNDAISIIDVKNFNILYANKKFFELYGSGQRKIIGEKCYTITHQKNYPCDSPHDKCPLCVVIKTGKHVSLEHLHIDKEGRKRYVEVSASPITYENGKATTVIHVARDMTEKKQMMDRLTESYRHLGVINRKLALLLDLDREIQRRSKKDALPHILSVALSLSKAFSVSLYQMKKDGEFHLLFSSGLGGNLKKRVHVFQQKNEVIFSKLSFSKKIIHGRVDEGGLGGLTDNKRSEYFLVLPLIESKKWQLQGFLFFEFVENQNFSPDEIDFYEVFAHQITPLLF